MFRTESDLSIAMITSNYLWICRKLSISKAKTKLNLNNLTFFNLNDTFADLELSKKGNNLSHISFHWQNWKSNTRTKKLNFFLKFILNGFKCFLFSYQMTTVILINSPFWDFFSNLKTFKILLQNQIDIWIFFNKIAFLWPLFFQVKGFFEN